MKIITFVTFLSLLTAPSPCIAVLSSPSPPPSNETALLAASSSASSSSSSFSSSVSPVESTLFDAASLLPASADGIATADGGAATIDKVILPNSNFNSQVFLVQTIINEIELVMRVIRENGEFFRFVSSSLFLASMYEVFTIHCFLLCVIFDLFDYDLLWVWITGSALSV